MKAFAEHLSGIIRVGPGTQKYGDPFDFAVAYSSTDGKTAVVKALISSDKPFTLRYARAIIKELNRLGLKPVWERHK